jgi:hypothetical protein
MFHLDLLPRDSGPEASLSSRMLLTPLSIARSSLIYLCPAGDPYPASRSSLAELCPCLCGSTTAASSGAAAPTGWPEEFCN